MLNGTPEWRRLLSKGWKGGASGLDHAIVVAIVRGTLNSLDLPESRSGEVPGRAPSWSPARKVPVFHHPSRKTEQGYEHMLKHMDARTNRQCATRALCEHLMQTGSQADAQTQAPNLYV